MEATSMSTLTLLGNLFEITDKEARADVKELKKTMIGATDSASGSSGLVPYPAAGDQDKFLRGDGKWAEAANKNVETEVGDLTDLVENHITNTSNPHEITPAQIGAAKSSHGTHVSYSTSLPAAPGTANAGSATTIARSDHVHPLQTSVSGNAGSASKVNNDLTVKFNNGTTEGTNMFTFNGSVAKSVNITPSAIGAAAASHGAHTALSGNIPNALGTASAGSGTTAARYDHVHAMPKLGELANVIISSEEPSSPTEGLIWIQIPS